MQEAIQQYVEREGGPRELQERSLGVVDRISGNWPASDRPGSARVAEQLGDGSGSRESEEHTSELQSRLHLVCRLLLEKKKNKLRRSEQRASTPSYPTSTDTPSLSALLHFPRESSCAWLIRSSIPAGATPSMIVAPRAV